MSFNPYREHDAAKGSLSAKILGGASVISGTGVMLKGAMRGNPFLMGLGAVQHYAGARTFAAGRKRPGAQPVNQHPYQPQYSKSPK